MIWCILSFHTFSLGIWLKTHIHHKNSQKNTPNFIPHAKMVEIMSIGHQITYADFLWISLIQYIADNIFTNSYWEFSTEFISTITSANPFFAPAYEWGLLLLHIPQNSNLTYDEHQKKLLEKPLNIALKGMPLFCDMKKIHIISELGPTPNLWKNEDLRNPCKSGTLAYHIGFYGWQLGDNPEIARTYYTIAAMHDDAPEVSRILAVLANNSKEDPKGISLNFTLLALGGYDDEPYQCHTLSQKLLDSIGHTHIDTTLIQEINTLESSLLPTDNASQRGVKSCYEMLQRALKFFYLAYVTEKSAPYPNVLHADVLVEKNIIPYIPTPQMHSGMTMKKINNVWNYAIR